MVGHLTGFGKGDWLEDEGEGANTADQSPQTTLDSNLQSTFLALLGGRTQTCKGLLPDSTACRNYSGQTHGEGPPHGRPELGSAARKEGKRPRLPRVP